MGLVNQVKTRDTMPQEKPPAEVDGLMEKARQEAETPESDDLTDDERKVYDSAMAMAGEILYKGDQSSNAMMEQVAAGDPMQTIPTTVTFIIDQIEQTFNGEVPEDLILPMADEISDMVIEMADTAGVIKADEKTATQIKGAVVEEILDAYGVDEAQMQEAMQGVSADDIEQMQAMFGGQ